MQGLSIIVCSINKKLFNSFESNINTTIGSILYEIIRIENNIEKLSITQAYNKGASQAQYSYLLFIHEDVLFHTSNWGTLLITSLKDETIGVVGVAGSNYVPYAPIGYVNPVKKYNFYHLLQRKEGKVVKYDTIPSENIKIKALDGVFLACRRNIWAKFKFNETLKGFHSYDLDFSLRVSKEYNNKITNNILIEHLSRGNPNIDYLNNNIQIKKNIKITNSINDPYNEYSSFRNFISKMKSYNFQKIRMFKLGIQFISIEKFGILNSFKAVLFLMKNIIL